MLWPYCFRYQSKITAQAFSFVHWNSCWVCNNNSCYWDVLEVSLDNENFDIYLIFSTRRTHSLCYGHYCFRYQSKITAQTFSFVHWNSCWVCNNNSCYWGVLEVSLDNENFDIYLICLNFSLTRHHSVASSSVDSERWTHGCAEPQRQRQRCSPCSL